MSGLHRPGLHRSQEKVFWRFLLLAVICSGTPGLAAAPQPDAKPLQQLADDFWACTGALPAIFCR